MQCSSGCLFNLSLLQGGQNYGKDLKSKFRPVIKVLSERHKPQVTLDCFKTGNF